jgi:transposase-like protein
LTIERRAQDSVITAHRHRQHPTELKIRLAQSYLNGEGSLKSFARKNDASGLIPAD